MGIESTVGAVTNRAVSLFGSSPGGTHRSSPYPVGWNPVSGFDQALHSFRKYIPGIASGNPMFRARIDQGGGSGEGNSNVRSSSNSGMGVSIIAGVVALVGVAVASVSIAALERKKVSIALGTLGVITGALLMIGGGVISSTAGTSSHGTRPVANDFNEYVMLD